MNGLIGRSFGTAGIVRIPDGRVWQQLSARSANGEVELSLQAGRTGTNQEGV